MVQLNLQLPEHFLDGETRDGYYVSSEMKKVWAVELDLLNEFMRVCKKHNLKWFADGGTILGAVRHKGFIPWDDDIDVMMMRNEYEELCKIAPSEFLHPYFWQNEDTDPGCLRQHSRLRNSNTTGILLSEKEQKYSYNQGIFIDIFPIDKIPENENERGCYIAELSQIKSQAVFLRNMVTYYRPKKGRGISKYIKHLVKHVLYLTIWSKNNDYNVYYQKLEKCVLRYDNSPTKEIAKLVLFPITERRFWKKEWLEDAVFLPFEMFELPIPIGYEALLDRFYGNWHEYIVGTSTHGQVFFDTEKSYKEYIK